MKPTRAERRHLRRNASSIAAILAATTVQRGPGGTLSCVTDPTALGALRRGFKAMLRNGCEPVVIRLTGKEGDALPHRDPAPPGATWWAGFGLDVDRRGTWSTTWSVAHGLTDEEERELAEVRVLEMLAQVANVSGLPAEANP